MLLEWCLLYGWCKDYENYDEEEMNSLFNTGMFLCAGQSEFSRCEAIYHVVCQNRSNIGDCIDQANAVMVMLRAVGIDACIRFDIEKNEGLGVVGNHHNVIAYPKDESGTMHYYLIDTAAGQEFREIGEWSGIVLDREAKTCRIAQYNGLDCKNLVVPEQITIWGKIYTVTEFVYRSIFYSSGDSGAKNTNISNFRRAEVETVVLPSTVKKIDDDAFFMCDKLVSVTGMTGVEDFCFSAFNGCTSLATLNFYTDSATDSYCNVIPKRIADTGTDFFQIGEITYEEGITALGERDNVSIGSSIGSGITKVSLPSTLTYIGQYAFSSGSDLESLVIPSGVTEIDEHAFDFDRELADKFGISNSGKPYVKVIYGTAGSAAETAAAQVDEITFVPIDSDGKFSLADMGNKLFRATSPTSATYCTTDAARIIGLAEGKDYTLTSIGNNQITAAAVAGGRCTGSYTMQYVDTTTKLSTCKVTLDKTSYTYEKKDAGDAFKPTVTVTHNGTTLQEGVDYTVSGDKQTTEIGTYTILVTGIGSYSGIASVSYAVVGTSLSDCVVTLSNNSYVYQKGSTYNPYVTVTYHGNVLTLSKDYTVSGNVQTIVGTHIVTVTAKAGSNYGGSATVSFTVTPRTLAT